MTGPESGPTPLLTLISRVWAVVGALALVVALVTTSIQVTVFGVLALVGAGVLYGVQDARGRSLERSQRVLHPQPMPPPAPRASDVSGRSPGDPPTEEQPAAGDGEAGGGDTGDTAPAPPRRSGPRPRPEPDVPRTARNRGRRNPTAGRSDPPPREDPEPPPTEVEETDETDEADVVDEPEARREPDDADITDAETVEDSPDDRAGRSS